MDNYTIKDSPNNAYLKSFRVHICHSIKSLILFSAKYSMSFPLITKSLVRAYFGSLPSSSAMLLSAKSFKLKGKLVKLYLPSTSAKLQPINSTKSKGKLVTKYLSSKNPHSIRKAVYTESVYSSKDKPRTFTQRKFRLLKPSSLHPIHANLNPNRTRQLSTVCRAILAYSRVSKTVSIFNAGRLSQLINNAISNGQRP